MTLRQIEYAGLMTAVALSRENFPDSLSYKTLLQRFSCLMKSSDRQNMKQMAVSDQIVYMLTNLFMSMFQEEDASSASMPFACGNSKAYLRAGALEHLEFLRYEFLSHQTSIIQKEIRRLQGARKYALKRESIVSLQALWRCVIVRRSFQQKKNACLLLKSWFFQQRTEEMAVNQQWKQAAEKIQATWRAVKTMRKFKELLSAVTTIQKKYRRRQRKSLAFFENDTIDSGVSVLLRRVTLRRGSLSPDCSTERSLLEEVET
jgi:myosin-5